MVLRRNADPVVFDCEQPFFWGVRFRADPNRQGSVRTPVLNGVADQTLDQLLKAWKMAPNGGERSTDHNLRLAVTDGFVETPEGAVGHAFHFHQPAGAWIFLRGLRVTQHVVQEAL